MNQLIMVRGRTGKITVSPSRTEAVVCNRCEYQFPEIVGSDISTNNNCIFHISTVIVVSIVVGDCIKKIGSLCAYFVDMVSLVKTQVENGMSRLFNL